MHGSENLLVRCVGALVFDERNRLLLIQRAQEPESGRWSLPGGRVEKNETDEQALRREVLEETNLTVTVRDEIGSVQRTSGNRVLDIHDYLCQALSGELRAGDDAGDARYADRATLITLDASGKLTSGLLDFLTRHNSLPQ